MRMIKIERESATREASAYPEAKGGGCLFILLFQHSSKVTVQSKEEERKWKGTVVHSPETPL